MMNAMKHMACWALAVCGLAACTEPTKDYKASGLFEATEVIVAAEQNGKILQLNVEEGQRLEAGREVGVIDTIPFYLKAQQVGATKQSLAVQQPAIDTQVAALRQELAKAELEQARYGELVKHGAANQKTLDDVTSQVNVLRKQLAALTSTLTKSTANLQAQMRGADVQRLMAAEELRRCHIVTPMAGMVLQRYAEMGEVATIGRPLFKMADTDHLFLRAYLTLAQLQEVKLGSPVTVLADFGKGKRRSYKGTISWISAKAEFTPKTILTDDERADQVYAVKIALTNDGYVKIGMTGEVNW